MHIEPGYVAPAKLVLANATAIGVFAWYGKEQLKKVASSPWVLAKTAAATVFFSLFMQSFHMPVGPSELHFVGAMAMYLTFGFLPTMLGFAIGLLVQGLLFEPTDLVHLGVNSLTLMLPLATVHYLKGKELFSSARTTSLSWAKIVQLDAMYYTGVTAMVGFWLMIGEVQTPIAAWATFAVSYLAIVAIEPVVTMLAVYGLKRFEDNSVVANLFVVNKLHLA